jgi:hypothetical protein
MNIDTQVLPSFLSKEGAPELNPIFKEVVVLSNWPLYRLSFDLRFLVTPLVSSTFLYTKVLLL